VGYIILSKNRSQEGFGFLIFVVIIAFLICRNALSYADIFISADTFEMKKVWGSRTRNMSEYKKIGKAVLPFTFYIEFKNGEKVYFFAPLSDIWEGLKSSDPDKDLKALRLRFKKEQLASGNIEIREELKNCAEQTGNDDL
jgi:hypothetical protein